MTKLALDFPLCCERAADQVLRADVEAAVAYLMSKVGDRPPFSALVMAGATARGEGTVLQAGGRSYVLSDIDLIAVFDDDAAARQAARTFPLWSREIGQRLRRGTLCSHVDYGVTHRQDLAAMGPLIFSYELRETGKVLWGDPSILSTIPAFTPAAIPQADVVWLLFNRILGQLLFWHQMDSLHDNEVLFSIYHTGKAYVDLVTALSLMYGFYVPSYGGRLEGLKRHDEALADLWQQAPGLRERMITWSANKLRPEPSVMMPAAAEAELRAQGRREWLEAVKPALLLLEKSLALYLGEDQVNLPALLEKYLRRTRHGLADGRAWLSVWRRYGRPKMPLWRTGLTALQGSPLEVCRTAGALLMSAAAGAQTGTAAEVTGLLRSVQQTCPFRLPAGQTTEQQWAALSLEISELWRWLVKGGGE